MRLYKKFKSYINKENMVNNNDKLLLGVSGGPDSLTMFDLFLQLRQEMNLDLNIFHLNHQFREKAKYEAEFVQNLCKKYNLECFIEEFDVPSFAEKNSLSSEQAAREVRFDYFFNIANEIKADKIALAHNEDDLVETVFLHMIRGCGLGGLRGIDPVLEINNHKIIHPLLTITRDEIEKYCKDNKLNPRRDESNQKTIYTRNKIRHELIPYVEKEINPSVKNVISRMTDILREEDNYLDELSEKKLENATIEKEKNKIILSFTKLNNLHEVLQKRVIIKAIYRIKEEQADIYFKHYQEIKKILKKDITGKRINLPGKIIIRKDYDQIIINNNKSDPSEKDFKDYYKKLNTSGYTILPDGNKIYVCIRNIFDDWQKEAFKKNKCLIDFEKVSFPLKVRTRKAGDIFKPLGMDGFKKIKDFFIDEKVSRKRRAQIPIILDNNNKIIWIVGYRIDDRVKINNKTKKVIEIYLLNEGENSNE